MSVDERGVERIMVKFSRALTLDPLGGRHSYEWPSSQDLNLHLNKKQLTNYAVHNLNHFGWFRVGPEQGPLPISNLVTVLFWLARSLLSKHLIGLNILKETSVFWIQLRQCDKDDNAGLLLSGWAVRWKHTNGTKRLKLLMESFCEGVIHSRLAGRDGLTQSVGSGLGMCSHMSSASSSIWDLSTWTS